MAFDFRGLLSISQNQYAIPSQGFFYIYMSVSLLLTYINNHSLSKQPLIFLSIELSLISLIALIDYYFHIIPNSLLMIIFLVKLFQIFYDDTFKIGQILLTNLSMTLILTYIIKKILDLNRSISLGSGDIKLFLTIGGLYGWFGFLIILTGSIFLTFITCLISHKKSFAFAPSLFVSCLLWTLISCQTSYAAQTISDGPIEGFGRDIPISLAIRQIVPPHLVVVNQHTQSLDQKISWSSASSWQDLLKSMLRPYDIEVDFQGQDVILRDKKIPLWQKTDHWTADIGEDLASILKKWAQKVNVTPVIHSHYLYPLESRIIFDGDFQLAITKLIHSFSMATPKPILDLWIEGENFTVELSQGETQ
jgi:hypothetical protein